MDDIEQWHAELIKKLIKALELKTVRIKLHPNIFSWWNVEDIFHEIENVLSNQEATFSAARGATNAITTIEPGGGHSTVKTKPFTTRLSLIKLLCLSIPQKLLQEAQSRRV